MKTSLYSHATLMRDQQPDGAQDLKDQAKRLQKLFKNELGLKNNQALEAVAKIHGYEGWSHCLAHLEAQRQPETETVQEDEPSPASLDDTEIRFHLKDTIDVKSARITGMSVTEATHRLRNAAGKTDASPASIEYAADIFTEIASSLTPDYQSLDLDVASIIGAAKQMRSAGDKTYVDLMVNLLLSYDLDSETPKSRKPEKYAPSRLSGSNAKWRSLKELDIEKAIRKGGHMVHVGYGVPLLFGLELPVIESSLSHRPSENLIATVKKHFGISNGADFHDGVDLIQQGIRYAAAKGRRLGEPKAPLVVSLQLRTRDYDRAELIKLADRIGVFMITEHYHSDMETLSKPMAPVLRNILAMSKTVVLQPDGVLPRFDGGPEICNTGSLPVWTKLR